MTTTEERPVKVLPRMQQRYRDEIIPVLQEQFSYANPMLLPKPTKVVVNMGVGDAARDSKIIDGALRDLTAITGQKPALAQGPRLDRPVQASRGHADRLLRDASWRPDVGVPRPAGLCRSAPYP